MNLNTFLKWLCIFTCCGIAGPLLSAEEISYSHVDHVGVPLDQKLIQLMNGKNGIFIEAGANDGIRQSNTKRLEEFYGWTGILIEPSASLYSELCINRPHSICFQCALGSFEQDGTLIQGDFDGDLMSSVNGVRRSSASEQIVVIRSLQSILDEVRINHVNFFSLDTEGYELNILQGIDFDRTSIDYLLIEIYKSQYAEIISFLTDKGYELIENFTNYNLADNPGWDGTHNDYLFKKRPN